MKHTPYWWEDRREPTASTIGDGPLHTDILVIGAGYTGLSAAIAASDGGASVVVVDAGEPGAGASSRNGGMFGAHPRLSYKELVRKFGSDAAMRLFREAPLALTFAQDLIAREGIACDLQNTGRIQLSWTKADFEGHKRLAAFLSEKTGVEATIVERADLGNEIGTDRYFGGLVIPQHCAIHPAKYFDGLRAAVARRGVPIFANRPVTRLQRTTSFKADTPMGQITADKVILATNGYTDGAFPWHQRRIFPLPSFLIATEPLSANLLTKLAPGGRMMVETRARHSYFRLSPDKTRILWGGRASMKPISPEVATQRLRATMEEIWPETHGVALTHSWSGNTGFSFTHMPHVGEQDGLHYAMGFSGSGTVMAPYLGAKAAWRALGDDRGETAYAETTLGRHILHPGGTPHFLKAADLWYRFAVDPAQNRAAARDRR
ncbi:MAG: NAD(P)/FAD-dependent oxidoreductase [Pikeienuella sp.]